MKRILSVGIILILLTGCTADDSELNTVLRLREQLQNSAGCSFLAQITADYVDAVYKFSMECKVNDKGQMFFTVVQPKTIADITGEVSSEGGKLTFNNQILAFETLADGLITPVSAPWLMVKTLKGGYVIAAGKDGNDIHTVINDSYEEQALQLDYWLDVKSTPVYCEILWQGSRILSIEIENFVIL